MADRVEQLSDQPVEASPADAHVILLMVGGVFKQLTLSNLAVYIKAEHDSDFADTDEAETISAVWTFTGAPKIEGGLRLQQEATPIVGEVGYSTVYADTSGQVHSIDEVGTNYVLVRSDRSITLTGTANEVDISTGAQDLSADRTWTIGLPDSVAITTALTVGGTAVSVAGHGHTASDVSDFDTEVGNHVDVAANTTHRASTGADHSYIDQSVISGASPTFTGTNFTSIPAAALGGVLEDLDTLGAPASDGQFIVATGVGAFAYESGGTARTSLGLGNVEDTALSTWAGTSSITTVGTLVSGAVPASLVTAGTFGAGAYTFPSTLAAGATTITTAGGSISLKDNGEIKLTRTGSGTNKWITTDEDNSGTGRMMMQAGIGSSSTGGGIGLYAQAHATHPGDVVAAVSTGAGFFRVNSNGNDTGTTRFSVAAATGNTVIAGTLSAGATTIRPATQYTQSLAFGIGTLALTHAFIGTGGSSELLWLTAGAEITSNPQNADGLTARNNNSAGTGTAAAIRLGDSDGSIGFFTATGLTDGATFTWDGGSETGLAYIIDASGDHNFQAGSITTTGTAATGALTVTGTGSFTDTVTLSKVGAAINLTGDGGYIEFTTGDGSTLEGFIGSRDGIRGSGTDGLTLRSEAAMYFLSGGDNLGLTLSGGATPLAIFAGAIDVSGAGTFGGNVTVSGTLQVYDAGNSYSATFKSVGGAQVVAIGNISGVPAIQGFTTDAFSANDNLSLQPQGNNVLIGTTTDTYGKFQVLGEVMFGNSLSDSFYTSGNELNSRYGNNAEASMWINRSGYQNGATQFRDLVFGDGKQAEVARIDGSAGALVMTGDLSLATKTPASAAAAGLAGTIAYDSSYIYICVATDTWERAALTSW